MGAKMVNDDQTTPSNADSSSPEIPPDVGTSRANDEHVADTDACRVQARVPPHATALCGLQEERPKHQFQVSIFVLLSIAAAIGWLIVIFRLEGPACAPALMMSVPEECVPEVMAFRHWSWTIAFVIILAFVIGIGHHVTGDVKSVLIDDRNKISLSRLQLVLWSVLVLSAFPTALAWNLVQDDCVPREDAPADRCQPFDLSIPDHLLLLMGISSSALIGAHLIKSQQLSKKKLHFNLTRDEARWTDIFETEGNNDRSWLDFGKIQMFLFTVILILAYAAVVGSEFAESDNFAFPELPETAVLLLGISQIGYLATKATQN